MPAYAHGRGSDRPDTVTPVQPAEVIDLGARRLARTAPAPLEDPTLVAMLVEQGLEDPAVEVCAAAQAWERAVAVYGVSLADPTVARAVPGIADFLERLAYGALTLREGDPARGIVPNPDDGLDRVSARMLVGLARDLREAPGHVARSAPPGR